MRSTVTMRPTSEPLAIKMMSGTGASSALLSTEAPCRSLSAGA